MSPQLWWYAARATGYVAWALVSASVVFGLLVSTRLARGRMSPAWALDLHRFLGGASVVFTALHLAGLVADSYVHFGPADLLVPLASSWKPGPVALGVVALYLLVAVQGTSMMMRRLPRRLWRAVHLSGYAVFWLASFHLLAAGTDAANPWSRAAVDLVVALVVFLSLVRALSGRPARGGRASARPAPRAASPASR
ncbi:MAG TPA: ferric reductase-like transmembrane domain-containing protein [Acidimicrobiales bacterium]|nr:ferric reductase-like transmembrane domain-containing protein [Acidimicrobiales bacterium]